ncbi:hypothetical protein AA0472_2382 [Acetobacter estunensis NRIC 0472]|nr:hypothetical protein AA0472_2382 [Acetobacter estunensis NRIC 0472]
MYPTKELDEWIEKNFLVDVSEDCQTLSHKEIMLVSYFRRLHKENGWGTWSGIDQMHHRT